MPRIVTSKVHLQISAPEAWRARCSLDLETTIAALGKRKLTLLEEELVHEGASDEHQRRLVRCELMSDFLGGSIMGVKTADLASKIASTHYTHLFDEAHGAEFSVVLALKRVGLSISGRQWCLPESETSCFLCTRVHLGAKVPGLGGLIEMQVERQMCASHAAFPEHAYTYIASAGNAPAPVALPMPVPAPLPECGSSRPTLSRMRLVSDAIARGLQRGPRRHIVLQSAVPGDTVPLRVERRTARLLLGCGCASAIVDSDEIIE